AILRSTRATTENAERVAVWRPERRHDRQTNGVSTRETSIKARSCKRPDRPSGEIDETADRCRVTAAFASAALAQGMAGGRPGEVKGGRGHRGANDCKKAVTKPKYDEKAYQDALQKIPDSREKYDPWGVVRTGQS